MDEGDDSIDSHYYMSTFMCDHAAVGVCSHLQSAAMPENESCGGSTPPFSVYWWPLLTVLLIMYAVCSFTYDKTYCVCHARDEYWNLSGCWVYVCVA